MPERHPKAPGSRERHACGFKLANDGHDTRAIQAYLGHRSIMSTVRYTALTPNRFKNFWKDLPSALPSAGQAEPRKRQREARAGGSHLKMHESQ